MRYARAAVSYSVPSKGNAAGNWYRLVASSASHCKNKIIVTTGITWLAWMLISGLSLPAIVFPGLIRAGRTDPAVNGSRSGIPDPGVGIVLQTQGGGGASAQAPRLPVSPGKLVSRVAFGSCTTRQPVPQPIWTHAVVPSKPDAWIWAGDIAYLDVPLANCVAEPQHPHCNCTRNWLRASRWTCMAGNIDHARSKLRLQMTDPDYLEFLSFMCPGYDASAGRSSRAPEQAATQLSACARPVLGTWDDHDYNWMDGNRRHPTKELQKQLFLDALGEPEASPRREQGRAIYTKHVLNAAHPGREIAVLLLDTRWQRDMRPCEVRQDLCRNAALLDPKKDKHAWCLDFLTGASGNGTCCRKDERMQEWCACPAARESALWPLACDPLAPEFGSVRLAWDGGTGEPVVASVERGDEEEDALMCEMLGPEQRQWLTAELSSSSAALTLVVTSSPLVNNPNEYLCAKALKRRPASMCRCMDDWDCFRPAQTALLHALARSRSCALVLTGDLHFSDIKVVHPGEQPYAAAYRSHNLARPVYQVMASGLTSGTAHNRTCEELGQGKATGGLRQPEECSVVTEPSFGMIEVEWERAEPRVNLQVISGVSGVVKLQASISLEQCR